MGNVMGSESGRVRLNRSAPTLMPEFAIGMTVLLIAAPVVLVGGTLWMALRKRLSHRSRRQFPSPKPHDAVPPT